METIDIILIVLFIIIILLAIIKFIKNHYCYKKGYTKVELNNVINELPPPKYTYIDLL